MHVLKKRYMSKEQERRNRRNKCLCKREANIHGIYRTYLGMMLVFS